VAVVKAEALRGHDHETADEKVRAIYGCDKPVEPGSEWKFGGFIFDRCPAHYVQDASFSNEVFSLWNWREKGFLPFAGGMLDQPVIYIEAMDLMDFLVTELKKTEAVSFKNKGGLRG